MSAPVVSEAPSLYGIRTAAANEQRVLLHNVSWATFNHLLNDVSESNGFRLAYDNGDLEIMAPSPEHERCVRPFEIIMGILGEELGFEFLSYGEAICKHSGLKKGIQPDACYYIQNAPKIIALGKLSEFPKDLPPDLMIEIDISGNSGNKLPICAALGVPEHWRFDGEKLEIRILKNGRYVDAEQSAAIPGLPLKDTLPGFINLASKGSPAMISKFRAWVRSRLLLKKKRKNA